jgi:eukaryotic-like serine/threonine-protein kinase
MPFGIREDAPPPSPRPQRIAFDNFEVNLRAGELRKNGSRIRLQAQPFQLLSLLLLGAGEVVTREEICRELWPGNTFVDFEHSMAAAVNKIREALGDAADNPKYVETLPRRGYRFIAKIQPEPPVVMALRGARESTELVSIPATKPKTGWKWILGAIAVVVVAAAVATFSARWFSSRERHPLTEKDSIVLADFSNSTGDPVFDGTLREGLSIELEQSPFLNVLSDEKTGETLRMMGRPQDTKLVPEIAKEVCQRNSSAAVLDGSIAQIGEHYLLTLKAVDCANGDSIATVAAQAKDKTNVLDALGQASSEIRSKLGESLISVQKFNTPLDQATTSSLEALKAFSLYGSTSNFSFLQQSLALDPNFPLANVQMSDTYSSLGATELAAEYAQKAYDRREQVSEKERLQISSDYYYAILGDLNQELTIYPLWERLYPRDAGPWINSSSTRENLGEYDLALEEAREGFRLNPSPFSSSAYLNVAYALLALDRKDEAKQLVGGALERGLDAVNIRLFLYQVAFLERDTKEMEAQLAPMLGRSAVWSTFALFAQSSTEAYFGRLRKSLGYSKRGQEMARQASLNELAAISQDADALREAEFGYPGKATRTAAAALTRSSSRRVRLFTSLALARAGDTGRAQMLADQLNKERPSDTLLQRYWLPTIRASIELAQKHPSEALEALQSASYEFGDANAQSLVGNLYPAYVRGQAYLAAHQGKEAAAEFQRFLDHRFIALNSPLGALVHLGLARAYSLQGDTTKARESYDSFLGLWKEADPDIPVFIAAKAEYAKLK